MVCGIDLLTNGLRLPQHPAKSSWGRYRVWERELCFWAYHGGLFALCFSAIRIINIVRTLVLS